MFHNTLIRILIIEDDFVWRSKIQMLVEQMGISTYGSTGTVTESKAFLETNEVDLIIADVLLQGNTVFDLFKQSKSFCLIPTIFITKSTADQNYNAASIVAKHLYLIKPIHQLTLQSAIENLLKDKLNAVKNVNYIAIKGSHNEIVKLEYKHIKWIKQEKNYCFLKTIVQTYAHRKSLKEIALQLPPYFLRIHKSCYVNTLHVSKVSKNLTTLVICEITLKVGRSYKTALKNYLATEVINQLERY